MSSEREPQVTSREGRELELLALRCQLGEPAAFDELVARFHESLWRYVRSLTGDPAAAEEVLQDGWLRILRGIGRLRQPERLKAWLFSIVRRASVDRLRARYADAGVEPLEEEPAGQLSGAAADELAWEDVELLRTALDHLPPPDRETVVLFYLHELDLREVAEVLAVPVGTVKSRLHRARRLLRAELEPKGASR